MKKFLAGMVAMVVLMGVILYVVNAENNKLKIENDRLQAEQNAYIQQSVENETQRQLDEIANALSQYQSYNTTSDSR
jgi:uncharacterized protein YxeA